MGNKFTFTLEGLKEFQKVCDLIVKLKRREVSNLVFRRAQDIRTGAIDKLRSMHAWNSGHLAGSIVVEMTEDKLAAEIGPSQEKGAYGPYVEFGTQPHWSPIEALEDWARKHGIPAFVVARKIAERGIFARPFMAPAFDAIVGYFDDDLRKIYEESEL